MALTRTSERGTDFRFPEGAYDVRGREVRTEADDEKVGKVDDVLVDDTGSPRYLDVHLGFLKKHVLLPVGHVRSDQDDEVIRVGGMSKEDFESIPEAVEGAVDRRYENRLVGAYEALRTEPVERVDQLREIQVAEDEPNPKGWPVVTADGELVGRVDHLIGDTEAMKVRYLSVELDGGQDRKVLIPTGYVALDTGERSVRLNALESAMVRRLPEYRGRLDRDYATRLHGELDRADLGPRWYEHPRYSTAGLFGTAGRTWV